MKILGACRYGIVMPDTIQPALSIRGAVELTAAGASWQDPNGNLNVLVLNWNDSKRKLNYNWFDNRWNRNYRFAARRPRNSPHFSLVR